LGPLGLFWRLDVSGVDFMVGRQFLPIVGLARVDEWKLELPCSVDDLDRLHG
jgi:hypothetical protein